MKTRSTAASSYTGHRFPQAIISHAVWLYHRFSLRYRDGEELLAARGVVVMYETVRQWCRTFGQQYANGLRQVLERCFPDANLNAICELLGG